MLAQKPKLCLLGGGGGVRLLKNRSNVATHRVRYNSPFTSVNKIYDSFQSYLTSYTIEKAMELMNIIDKLKHVGSLVPKNLRRIFELLLKIFLASRFSKNLHTNNYQSNQIIVQKY